MAEVSCKGTKSILIEGNVGVKEVSIAERVVVILKAFELSDACMREGFVQGKAVHTHKGILNCHCKVLELMGGFFIRLKVTCGHHVEVDRWESTVVGIR